MLCRQRIARALLHHAHALHTCRAHVHVQVLYEMDALRDARNPRLKELVSNTIEVGRVVCAAAAGRMAAAAAAAGTRA